MLDDVLGIPDQLRDALWRVEGARLEAADSAGLMVCGMGGSAIGADLAAAALGDRLTGPLLAVRGYALPSWVTPEWTVLCSSYSGGTEETLACFAAAEALGARRLVASTGGQLVEEARQAGVPVIGLPGIFQPRAAVAYMFTIAAEAAALAGVAPRIHTEIDAAAAFLAEQAEDLQARAKAIAAELGATPAVIYGADLTASLARRWKSQINENAKLPAYYSELPEADHNELCGWEGAANGSAPAAVFLEDADQHPRVRRRFEMTAELVAPHAAASVRVESVGETRVERLLWTLMLGDLVSLEIAELRGVDPAPGRGDRALQAGDGTAVSAMRAMVLAAGLGTRLRPLTYEMPKPMVPVLNRPVMEHILRLLARNGFTQTIANLHWFPELIEDRFGDGSASGVELSYSREEKLLGTAGGVRNAAGFLGDSFLIISGDALTDIDLAAMREFHESHDGIATLATKRVEDTSQFGVAITDAEGRIQGFQEKPDPAEALSDLANCGIYMFRSRIFDFFPAAGDQQGRRARRPARLRRLGDGRLPAPAGRRHPLLLARDRRLLERHRQPRGAARGQPRRAQRRGQGRCRGRGRRRLPQRSAGRRRGAAAGPGPARSRLRDRRRRPDRRSGGDRRRRQGRRRQPPARSDRPPRRRDRPGLGSGRRDRRRPRLSRYFRDEVLTEN